MTETEWLACTDPGTMLEFVKGNPSDRQLRLIAVACCRRIMHLLPEERNRHAVEVAERYADGAASNDELAQAYADARRIADECDPVRLAQYQTAEWDAPAAYQADGLHYAASTCARAAYPKSLAYAAAIEAAGNYSLAVAMFLRQPERHAAEEARMADLLRDILGDPFRSVSLQPAWQTPNALALAQGIYEGRAFDRLPILADALEEAGCMDADMLSHCRQGGSHVRGCWVLDLILAKR